MKPRKRTRRTATSSSRPSKTRQVLDCVLLPAPRRFKQNQSNIEITANRTTGSSLSQSEEPNQAKDVEVVEDARSNRTRESLGPIPPPEPTQRSWQSAGLITPAPSVENLASPTTDASPLSNFHLGGIQETSPGSAAVDLSNPIRVDETPAEPEEIGGSNMPASSLAVLPQEEPELPVQYTRQFSPESTARVEDTTEVRPPQAHISEDTVPGFQLLDPSECVMLPWTKVSTGESNLYVPAAFGDLVQQMRESLKREQDARLKAEERLLSLVLVRSEDEQKLDSAIQEIDVLRRAIGSLEETNRKLLEASVSEMSPPHVLSMEASFLARNSPLPTETSLSNEAFSRPYDIIS